MIGNQALCVLLLLCTCSENRYLLFLTENYAALDILKHYLRGDSEEDDQDLTSQPYILFGSSFPKDKEYTQVSIVFSPMDAHAGV